MQSPVSQALQFKSSQQPRREIAQLPRYHHNLSLNRHNPLPAIPMHANNPTAEPLFSKPSSSRAPVDLTTGFQSLSVAGYSRENLDHQSESSSSSDGYNSPHENDPEELEAIQGCNHWMPSASEGATGGATGADQNDIEHATAKLYDEGISEGTLP